MKISDWFSPTFATGCKAELVQLAVILALTPAVAGGTQASEWPVWEWCPLILPVHQDPSVLQCLPVSGDDGVPGAASGCAPSGADIRETLFLRTGAPHRSGKLRTCVYHCNASRLNPKASVYM